MDKEQSRMFRGILGRNSKPGFGPAKAKKPRAPPRFRATLPLSSSRSLLVAPARPKACLYRPSCDWPAGPVIHRKHRMQTVT